jgi:hypothetical protein
LRPKRSREGDKLELKFSRYEVYEDKIREVYRPKGLWAFTTAAREYVRLITVFPHLSAKETKLELTFSRFETYEESFL